jgi:hypothetical protein
MQVIRLLTLGAVAIGSLFSMANAQDAFAINDCEPTVLRSYESASGGFVASQQQSYATANKAVYVKDTGHQGVQVTTESNLNGIQKIVISYEKYGDRDGKVNKAYIRIRRNRTCVVTGSPTTWRKVLKVETVRRNH